MPIVSYRIDDATDFLTILETARLLRLSKRTLDNMRHTGSGPTYRKFGGRVVYLRADIIKWANDNEHQSTHKPSVKP